MLLGVCCLSDQRYNFLKANHNFESLKCLSYIVVYQIKDTIFWKQITTGDRLSRRTSSLFIRSKIQFFESKSQPFEISRTFACSCLSDQRYNFLKANHNLSYQEQLPCLVVYQIKDTIFWKQITTNTLSCLSCAGLFIRSKIQFFESKSQHRRRDACHKKSEV